MSSAKMRTMAFLHLPRAASAPHSRASDSTSVSRTALRSKVERLITFSTSAVAVWAAEADMQP
jgi:hypothetical protein